MKNLVRLAMLLAVSAVPLLAAPTTKITIPVDVTVGSAKLAAGDYKLSYEGSAPTVKVTLSRSGTAPVVINAKLVLGPKGMSDLQIETISGVHVLEGVDLKTGETLTFESTQK